MKRLNAWMIWTIFATLLVGCGGAEDPYPSIQDALAAPRVVTKQEPPSTPGTPMLPSGDPFLEKLRQCQLDDVRLDPQDYLSRCLSGKRFVDVPISQLNTTPGMTNTQVRAEIWRVCTPELQAQYGPDCLNGMTRHELVPNSRPDHVRCYLIDKQLHLPQEVGPIIHRPGYVGGVAQVRRMVCVSLGGVLTIVDFGAGYCEAAEDNRGSGGAVMNGLCNVMMPLPIPYSLNDAWKREDYVGTMFDRMNYQLDCESRNSRDPSGGGPPREICKYFEGDRGLSSEMQQAIVTCYNPERRAFIIRALKESGLTDEEIQKIFNYLQCPDPSRHYRWDLPGWPTGRQEYEPGGF